MGVRQQFKVEQYDWCETIYYGPDEGQNVEINSVLQEVECDQRTLKSIRRNLDEAKLDTGFCYSNFANRCSVIVVHKASSIGEFINTFEHEKNHLEMHICEALDINPYSEEAAHFSGDLAQIILEKALCSIVEL